MRRMSHGRSDAPGVYSAAVENTPPARGHKTGAAILEVRTGPQAGTVKEPPNAKAAEVVTGIAPNGEVQRHPTKAGADAEAMPAHAGTDGQSRQLRNTVHHRHHVRQNVDHSAPLGLPLYPVKRRIVVSEPDRDL